MNNGSNNNTNSNNNISNNKNKNNSIRKINSREKRGPIDLCITNGKSIKVFSLTWEILRANCPKGTSVIPLDSMMRV